MSSTTEKVKETVTAAPAEVVEPKAKPKPKPKPKAKPAPKPKPKPKAKPKPKVEPAEAQPVEAPVDPEVETVKRLKLFLPWIDKRFPDGMGKGAVCELAGSLVIDGKPMTQSMARSLFTESVSRGELVQIDRNLFITAEAKKQQAAKAAIARQARAEARATTKPVEVDSDRLTFLVTSEPCNKRVSVRSNKVKKIAGKPIGQGTATTIHIPDLKVMEQVLINVAARSDGVLIQGYAEGAENDGDQYQIMSQENITKITGRKYKSGWVDIDDVRTTGRLKKNFKPSSWWQLDRDYADGIPDELAKLTDEEWVQKIDSIMPGFAKAGYVRVASTSGRVKYKGEPLDAKGCRYWFQIEDPDDVGFGERLKMQAAANRLGFKKLNKKGHGTLWAIFDPTVFSCERLVYDGKPDMSDHEDLSLGEPDIQVHEGGRVDTSLIKPLTTSQKVDLKNRYGLTVTHSGSGEVSAVQHGNLTLDTVITVKRGKTTVREFYQSGEKKLRCQATFRDSTSWNGFLYLDYRGMPVLFDNGVRVRYELSDLDQVRLFAGGLSK